MRRLTRLAMLSAIFALPLSAGAGAGESCTEDAMIVFDGSGSMAEIGFNQIGVPRISEARLAMARVIPQVATVRRLGLVIYGPGGDRTCRNVDIRFAPQWGAGARIIADVDALRPAGGTSLTESVRVAADILLTRSPNGAIVLVTDGKETCGGEPCALAAELAVQAPGLAVHVIGFKMRGDHFDRSASEFPETTTVARCLADQTGGRYVGAETVDELIGALRVTLGCNVFGRLTPERAEPKTRYVLGQKPGGDAQALHADPHVMAGREDVAGLVQQVEIHALRRTGRAGTGAIGIHPVFRARSSAIQSASSPSESVPRKRSLPETR